MIDDNNKLPQFSYPLPRKGERKTIAATLALEAEEKGLRIVYQTSGKYSRGKNSNAYQALSYIAKLCCISMEDIALLKGARKHRVTEGYDLYLAIPKEKVRRTHLAGSLHYALLQQRY